MKSKIISISVLMVLIINAVTISIAYEDRNSKSEIIEIKKVFSEPHFNENGRYLMAKIDNIDSYIAEAGRPLLPFEPIKITFPLGTKIGKIDVFHSPVKEIRLNRKIVPAIPFPMNMKNEDHKMKEDESIYNSFSSYPEKWFSYSLGGGIENGKHVTILNLYVYPMKYVPKENIVQYVENIKIRMEVFPKSTFVSNEEYDLLVLSPEEFADELSPLIEHKNNNNVSSILVTLNNIPMNGRDKQEDIKYYIKDAIEKWGIRYVMLVGGKDEFPVRYTHITYAYGNEIIDDEVFVSDLYYADIYDENEEFSSWDTNNNDLFGEYDWQNTGSTDDVDLYPDVYVGRLACVDENEVRTAVEKIIRYENMKAYGEPWFSNVVVIGGDTSPNDDEDIDEGEYIGQKILDTMEGYNGIKIWASNNEVKYASNINSAIENGAGFVSFSGHGTPTSWATHPHNKEGWIPYGGYKNSNIEALTNSEKLPIVIIDACSNSKFDEISNCFGWTFVSNENGGAIATIGNSALSWGYSGSYTIRGLSGFMELGAFKSYKNGAKTFGEIWGETVNSYLNQVGARRALDYKTVEEWQAFGDPSLQISSPSLPPNKPDKPEGTTSGKKGIEYSFTTSATDPDGDDIYYLFDWGDGSVTDWLGPYKSGEKVNASHSWDKRGTYEIKVKAKDEYGSQSEWSEPLEIKIKFTFNSLLNKISEIFGGIIYMFLRNLIYGLK
ncbi:MAG TPA: PKD domain-containing protein [Thermoplasmatales archaeon]|nr:PKD domain-containing protein [Thermoplasmatales archaeon]